MLQQSEQWAAAGEIYRSILAVAPDHADALHFSGVLAHQHERSEQAVALIERSLELEPERADWYSNLRIVLQDGPDLDAAIAWASRCPSALHGIVEVRPLMDRSDDAQVQRLIDARP